jgi:hypothetical protein
MTSDSQPTMSRCTGPLSTAVHGSHPGSTLLDSLPWEHQPVIMLLASMGEGSSCEKVEYSSSDEKLSSAKPVFARRVSIYAGGDQE